MRKIFPLCVSIAAVYHVFFVGVLSGVWKHGYEFAPVVFPHRVMHPLMSADGVLCSLAPSVCSLIFTSPVHFDSGEVGQYSVRLAWYILRILMVLETFCLIGCHVLKDSKSRTTKWTALFNMFIDWFPVVSMFYRMQLAEHMTTFSSYVLPFAVVLRNRYATPLPFLGWAGLQLAVEWFFTRDLPSVEIAFIAFGSAVDVLRIGLSEDRKKPAAISRIDLLRGQSRGGAGKTSKQMGNLIIPWATISWIMGVVCIQTLLLPAVLTHSREFREPYNKNACIISIADMAHPEDRPFQRSPDQYFDSITLANRVCRYGPFRERFSKYLVALAREKVMMDAPSVVDDSWLAEREERLDPDMTTVTSTPSFVRDPSILQ
eukprot:ANDGO_08574.mRNA.1 hypothetical protein